MLAHIAVEETEQTTPRPAGASADTRAGAGQRRPAGAVSRGAGRQRCRTLASKEGETKRDPTPRRTGTPDEQRHASAPKKDVRQPHR